MHVFPKVINEWKLWFTDSITHAIKQGANCDSVTENES